MGWNVNVSMRQLRFGHTVERHLKFYIFSIAVKHDYTVGGLQVLAFTHSAANSCCWTYLFLIKPILAILLLWKAVLCFMLDNCLNSKIHWTSTAGCAGSFFKWVR